MNSETYKHYLRDLIYIIKEQHFKLEKESDNSDFSAGSIFAYSSIIDLMENQAESFQMNTEEIGWNDFEKFNQRK